MKKIFILLALYYFSGCQSQIIEESPSPEIFQEESVEQREMSTRNPFMTTIEVKGGLNAGVTRKYLGTNGKNVDLWYEVDNTGSHLWSIEPAGHPGMYYIKSHRQGSGSKRYLAISSDGKNVAEYYDEGPFPDGSPSRQMWYITKVTNGLLPDHYLIESASNYVGNNRKYLSANPDGRNVVGWHVVESDRQKWIIPGGIK